MNLDFRIHKKNKKFPFSFLGMIIVISQLLLFIYFTRENTTFTALLNQSSSKELLNTFYFSFIILNFLILIFSLAITNYFRNNLKFLLIMTLIGYSVFGILSGYFYISTMFASMMKFYYLFAFGYFILYLLIFLCQNNSFSVYTNIIVCILSSLPILPLSVIIYGIYNKAGLTNSIISIANDAYLVSIFLYVVVNSIYMIILNRKHR